MLPIARQIQIFKNNRNSVTDENAVLMFSNIVFIGRIVIFCNVLSKKFTSIKTVLNAYVQSPT